MVEKIPTRDTRKLTRSPIVNVIWQLQFTTDISLKDGRAALAFRDALGRDSLLTQQSRSDGIQVAVGGAGVSLPGASTENVWRLDLGDGLSVILASNSVAIETSLYSKWEDGFRRLIADIASALSSALGPGLKLRLGLRYVNVLFGSVFENEPFQQLTDFAGFIEPSLLGFDASGLGATVDMYQARHSLVFGDVKANLNTALLQSDGSELGFLVDVDCYAEHSTSFDVSEIEEASERLHDLALAVFQKCVVRDAWELMGPVDGQ